MSGSTCAKDPCSSAASGANTASGNIGFGSFVAFTNPSGGSVFQPGNYEIKNAGGCMKYGGGQGWTVNALGPDYTWYIGPSAGAKLTWSANVSPGQCVGTGAGSCVPPGASGYATPCPAGSTAGINCGFVDYASCNAFGLNLPGLKVKITSATTLGVFLVDGPNGSNNYGDNVAGSTVPNGKNPSWTIRSIDGACALP